MRCKFLCRECGKRSVIEVDVVTVIGDGADTVMYSLEIMCRRCGSHDVERVEPSEMELMLMRIGSAFREFEDVVFPEAVRAFGTEMEFSKMLPFARKRAREEPEDPETLVRLANVLRSMNRYDEAIPIYRKVLESHSDALEAALMCKEDELRSLLDKCHLLCSIEHIPEDALPVPRKEAMAKVLRYLRLFFREDGVPPDILRAYSERILGSHDTVFTFRTHHRRVARWMFEHAQVEEGTIGERMVTILEAEIERSRRKADIAHKLAALDFVHANPRSLSPGERERALEAGMRHSVGTVRELAFRYALLAADEREMPTLLARCGRDTNKAVTRTPVRILLAKDVPPEARARLLRFIDVRRLDLSPQQRSRVERMRREAEARRG